MDAFAGRRTGWQTERNDPRSGNAGSWHLRWLGAKKPTLWCWMRLRVTAGDVIVMPAGVSHEDVGHSVDNIMCGGYPGGRDWDNIQPEFLSQDLYLQACKRIMALPIPEKDPVSGEALHHWLDAPSSTEGWNDWRDSLDRSS